jgi:hypothetical protein
MVLNDLLDLGLQLRGNGASGDFLEESLLGGEMATELGFPLGDLVDGDGIELWKLKLNGAFKK